MPIRKLLIANRGEIAVRIAATCREMGIIPVMVYTAADRNAPHTRAGDQAVDIGESYINIERVIDAARKTGATAIHPGYGFLAENADFSEACRSAAIVFIGPTPEVIRTMGYKNTACELAASAGVPVVPSFHAEHITEFPVLIKASAGGGGRGMRIVRDRAELAEALESAKSEADRSFGDGSLLIERYIEGARHVEIQIFGDTHGNVIHLFERDCSVQRRHQKIIEESPSPALTDDLRSRMGDAAVALGRAIGYTNAGTVEFLTSPSGDFYFIEMNTRIQVEHPVTELVTGIDLVRLQIETAEGKPLPRAPRTMGHAIEARLYAEDPANGFLPSTGTVQVWRAPANVRVDAALEDGVEVGIHYDPMLAKIVSYAMDRESAVRKLVYALQSTVLLGLQTNREYLIQILESDEFREGRADTTFLPAARETGSQEHIIAAVLYREQTRKTPFPNYRNSPYRDPSVKLRVRSEEIEVSWKRLKENDFDIRCSARTPACRVHTRVNACGQITLTIDGISQTFRVAESEAEIFVSDPQASTTIHLLPRHPKPASATERETANSPMPGQVLRILVKEGQHVKPGDPLVVLEAMKMEQTIRTTIHGVVQSILVVTGQVVAPGQMLVQITAQETEP
ncbi:MAG TPA: biotin carboxylase N-terminal domain-containing protein [Bryobacteraceae bacterium]|nr:biotin carboxylase N-terminal domain-containing protein [Bryobacteraceae bacterium]